MKIHVIMACHNRREMSLRAVRTLEAAAKKAGVEVSFTAFDDGSSDGTDAALSSAASRISILHGDGSAFWAKSMATAEWQVLSHAEDTDWLVWLNDDVTVDLASFEVFLSWRMTLKSPLAVAIGAMADPQTGEYTYGGLIKSGVHPLRFQSVPFSLRPTLIHTFNGNLVFVPVSVARKVGGIDGSFSHALADIDYGLRCGKLEIPVFQLPGILGTCSRNEPEISKGFIGDWNRFVGTKGGGNYSSLRRILQKNSPRAWLLYLVSTYFLWWIRTLYRELRGKQMAYPGN